MARFSSVGERVAVMVMDCLLMGCVANIGTERGERGLDGGGVWCENKRSGLQTVEPTMVRQIQVLLRFMCPLYKH